METESARVARLEASEVGKDVYRETMRQADDAARSAEVRLGIFNRRDRRASRAKGRRQAGR